MNLDTIWVWKTCSLHGLEFRFRNSVKIFCTHLDTIVCNWFFIEQNNWCLSDKTMLFCTKLQKRAKGKVYYGDWSNGIAKACSLKLVASSWNLILCGKFEQGVMHNGLPQSSHQNEVVFFYCCTGHLLYTKQGVVSLFLFLPSAAGMLVAKCLSCSIFCWNFISLYLPIFLPITGGKGIL